MIALNATALLNAWEEGAGQPPLRRALLLLSLAWPERSAEQWAAVSMGERDARLFRLRERLFGTVIETVALCPQCSQRLEVCFTTREIRAESQPQKPADTALQVMACGYQISYRLPTSADLLALAEGNAADEWPALFHRCVLAAQCDGLAVDPAGLPEPAVKAVIDDMAKVDPQAETRMALACPACSHQWSMLFDIFSCLWGEIEDWAQRLLFEVHTLASAYGWSERDIVAMSARRRRLYLEMVGE